MIHTRKSPAGHPDDWNATVCLPVGATVAVTSIDRYYQLFCCSANFPVVALVFIGGDIVRNPQPCMHRDTLDQRFDNIAKISVSESKKNSTAPSWTPIAAMFYENLDVRMSANSLQLPTVTPLDFATTDLAPHYNNYYALLIDDCFTASECADLIGLADSDWRAAAKNTDFRDCSRIIKDDVVAAKRIYDRVKPFLEDVLEIEEGGRWWEDVVGKNGGRSGMSKGRWRMAR